jgi:hypothetical protein
VERINPQPRILCWILTQPKELFKKAIHVKGTWGKRCDILLFFSSENGKLCSGREIIMTSKNEAYSLGEKKVAEI